jgi:4'-phosphopantetheinyl transferase
MMAEPLGPGEARVWYARPEEHAAPEQVAALAALLSPDEQARHDRFRFPEDRQLYLVAHGLLRCSIGGLLGVDPAALRFQAGPHGKPELAWPPGSPLQFNLSHTRGLVAWIVTGECPAGIDVEDRRRVRDVDAVAGRFFAPSEVADVQARRGDDQRDRFLAYWTLKEAYLKARGVGLSLPLEAFAMTIDRAGSATVAFDGIDDDPSIWQLARLHLTSDHAAAVAIRTDRPLDVIAQATAACTR